MTYESKLTVKFDSKYTSSVYSSYETDSLPEEHFTFEVPTEDLNTTQVFGLFKKVMLTMGYCEQTIAYGMMSTVFNPDGDEKLMRKMCEEFELTMNEDVGKKVQEEVKNQLEIEETLRHKNDNMPPWGHSDMEALRNAPGTPGSYRKLYQENLDLKAKLSRLQNPDAPSYTDEEIDAMSYEESTEQKYVGRIHDNGVS
jgi:hypothetical protein